MWSQMTKMMSLMDQVTLRKKMKMKGLVAFRLLIKNLMSLMDPMTLAFRPSLDRYEESDDEEESKDDDASTVAGRSIPSHVDVDDLLDIVSDVITAPDLLSTGLAFVGFDQKRQSKAKAQEQKLNIDRFKAHFGEEPKVFVPLINDLKNKYGSINIQDFLMTVNWLKGYDTIHVLAGRWGRSERYIEPKVKAYARMIQSLKALKIRFEFETNEHKHYKATYDTVNFKVNELRLDPSNKWFDHKSHSAGLVREE